MPKVLIVKMGSLGDVLLTVPLIKILGKNFPEADIDFLTSRVCSEVVEIIPHLRQKLIAAPLQTSSNFLWEAIKTMQLLLLLWRDRGYQAVLMLHRSWFLNLLCRLVLGNKVYAFAGNNLTDKLLKGKARFDLCQHRIMRNVEVAKVAFPQLVYTEEDLKLECCLGKEDLPLGIRSSYIVIAPGGGKNAWSAMPSRRWPLDNYVTLARKIIDKFDWPVVLLGGKEETELGKRFVQEINSLSHEARKGGRVYNFIGEKTIHQSAVILRQASIFIGNDSFLLFLASAVSIPTIGLFGPTDAKLINPFGEQHIAIQSKASCSPCYNPLEGTKGKAYQCVKPMCMVSIGIDEVFLMVCEVLKVQNSKFKT